MDIILIILVLVFAAATWWQFTANESFRRVMRTALQKAERDKTEYIKLPRNQVIELLGWETQFSLRRTKKEFAAKPGPHPASYHFTKRKGFRFSKV